VISAPVTAVTFGPSNLGRIVNSRDGYPDEKRPFLFSEAEGFGRVAKD
jgi:hypothetical protein